MIFLLFFYLTIIPRVRVRYEMVGANEARSAKLVIIISYPTRGGEGNNCLIKNANKISSILPDFICKNNRFSACF